MKKTIKADKSRKILQEEFLNDNSLLELTMEDNRDILVGIRFVEGVGFGIKEHILTKMSIYDYLSEYSNLVKISEDSSAIAIFNKTKAGYQLDRLYNLEEHAFALDEFIDIVFEKKFPKLSLDKYLVLEKH